MKIDRRGDIGFMEAMAGAMTVCIVMLGFCSFVMTDAMADHTPQHTFDWDLVDGICLDGEGRYTLDRTSELEAYAEENGLAGISVDISAGSASGVGTLHIDVGKTSGMHIGERKLVSVSTEDGRSVPTLVEVTEFL
ncbi:MAG: hypothetical protein MJZ38_07530 [archaeon]|nr:hypothetical protein [archaeon]